MAAVLRLSTRHRLTAGLVIIVLEIALIASSSARATNPGSPYTITSPDTPGWVGLYTSLALDAAGNPVVSYFDATNENLKVLHCGDPACDGGNSIVAADTAQFVGRDTSLVLDSSGNPVVSYSDTYNADLKVLHCGNPNCTAGNTIVAPDTAGLVGYDTSLALDGAGYPVVGYFDATNRDLKLLHCGDANCTSGNTIASPDTVGDVGYAPSLVLDASGNPVVSYQGSTEYGLKVLHCGDTVCSAGNSIVTAEPGLAVNPSLALDSSGNPVVAFSGQVNFQSQLRLLHCGNANCASGNVIHEVDAVSANEPSLALGGSDRPIITYGTVYYLRVAHCGDSACGVVNGIVWADTAGETVSGGSVGGWSSLRLDALGSPVVSYFADVTDDLKVLHCGQADCWSDQDKDGCPDEREQQLSAGTEMSGGRRDPQNPWDYFNPTHDHKNRVDDILMVVHQFFKDSGNLAYNIDTDRTLLGPNAWNLGPPNGQQRVDDILNIVHQFFHDC